MPLVWENSWYYRYSHILLKEISSLETTFSFMKSTQYDTEEMEGTFLQFYACTLAIIRFLEGISWGYSPMLIHDSLEPNLCIMIRVVYNLLLRIKQIYREDKTLGPEVSKYGDVSAVYCPEPVFQKLCSFERLD